MMKEIAILKDFGQDDLASDNVVGEIVNNLTIDDNKDILIDLRDCFIDYPYTSRIMDKILNSLAQLKDQKTFSIIYDLNAKEATLLNWFFLESTFLDIKPDEKTIELESLKKKIHEKISPHNIKIIITIKYDSKAEILKSYSYE